MAGLRERKKDRTRDELACAAVKLFIERGYDNATVEDIAAVADVSPRTFFRYFPSKEDAAIDLLQAGIVDLREELAARPAEEPLTVALREATLLWATNADQRAGRMRELAQVLRTSPSLRGRLEETKRAHMIELAGVVAARLGVPASDTRPQLVACLLSAVISGAVERWGEDGAGLSLADYVEAGLDMLANGVPCAVQSSPRVLSARPAGR